MSWPELFAKIGELQRQDYDWSDQVAALPMPVLLVFADADAVQAEHIMAFYGLLAPTVTQFLESGLAGPV